MRKYLVGVTAAVAGVALAAPAVAADDMMGGVSIGGSMEQDIGFGNWVGGAESADSMHFQTNAEMQFKASGETDGGLTISAQMELKGQKPGAVDESWMAISGGFGKITLGSDDSAANAVGSGGVGGGFAGGGYYDTGDNYTPGGVGGPVGGGDSQGIRYVTPVIGGFQAGVSFQPDHNADGATGTNTSGTGNDANRVAFGASFSADFAGSNLTLASGFVSDTMSDGSSSDGHGVGASLGIGDSTLSLRYDAANDTTTSYGVGVNHTMGAISLGIGFGTTVVEGAHVTPTGTADMTSTRFAAGGSYDMGGGVSLSASIAQGSVENSDAMGTDDDDVGVGLRIAFSF